MIKIIRLRLFCLFVVPFIFFTGIDNVSTYIAVNHYGASELNSFTDTSSLRALVVPEIYPLMLGLLSLWVGCKVNEAFLLSNMDWRDKVQKSLRTDYFGLKISLILVPIGVAFFRGLVGINNIMVILWGAGITSFPTEVLFYATGIPRPLANLMVLLAFVFPLQKKLAGLIFRAIETTQYSDVEAIEVD